MNIVTKKPNRFGRKIQFPIDGVITISEEGIAEVSDECGELMVKSGAGWEFADAKPAKKKATKKAEPKVEEPKEEVVAEETIEEVVEEPQAEEATEVETSNESEEVNFDDLTNKELRDVLKDAGVYDNKKHGKASKAKLISAIKDLM